jgi:tRNA pseudouridine38-40 synthase
MKIFLSRLRGNFPALSVPFLEREQPAENGLRHLALALAYNGAPWAGWQLQPRRPTIQGAVEQALGRLCAQPVRLTASGRTDAGVHAWGQVADFRTTSRLPAPAMLAGLRKLLPSSIFPLALGPVGPDFHARYSAQAKTYDYYLAPGLNCPAFLEAWLWALPWQLDQAAIREALALCPGRRDMRALSSGAQPGAAGTVRQIMEASLRASPDLWRIRVTASGFLRHALRGLVGILVKIGQGKLTPAQLEQMLAQGVKLYSAPKAPPCGLYLSQVHYAPWPEETEEKQLAAKEEHG